MTAWSTVTCSCRWLSSISPKTTGTPRTRPPPAPPSSAIALAGSGALSIPAARLGAQVLATDHSPVMLELLRTRVGQEPLAIETCVMDGHALELDDDSFDMAGSQAM